jgi:hypothetical protein
MGSVGGSRHYGGGGLGQTGVWACPACGAENQGPIDQGCALCGAGKPGRRVKPSTPPPPPPAHDDDPRVEQGDVADYWARTHPEASIAQAYRAGYLDGVREALAKTRAAEASPPLLAEDRARRTIIAALALFRDQVLASSPEEVTSGEWLSADEADAVIAELTELETTHA